MGGASKGSRKIVSVRWDAGFFSGKSVNRLQFSELADRDQFISLRPTSKLPLLLMIKVLSIDSDGWETGGLWLSPHGRSWVVCNLLHKFADSCPAW